MRRCLGLSFLLLLAGQATAFAQQAMLLPGDVVKIDVWQQEDFSGEFLVASDSTILHPLYREIRIAGIPLNEAEERVRQFLIRFNSSPSFAFEPLFRVFVGGEVRQPSQYTLPAGTPLGEALVRAGWLTERGNLEKIRLIREGSETEIDLSDPDSDFARSPVRSGDRIIVERRRNIFREYVAPSVSFVGGVLAIARYFLR